MTFIVYCAVMIVMFERNPGEHSANFLLKNLSFYFYVRSHLQESTMNLTEGYNQYGRVEGATYTFTVFLLKLSILLQYLRTFVPLKTRNAMYWACHILLWLNFVFYLVSFFLTIFICTPIRKSWVLWIEGRCLDFNMLLITTGVINTVSDLSILVLPQHVIWNLQISTKRKIRISAVFLPGVL